MSFNKCWDRAQKAAGFKNQTALANFLKIRTASVTEAKNRDSFPSDWAVKIAQYYGLSTDWILTGEGPMRREGGVAEEAADYKKTAEIRNEYIYVPKYDVRASAGHGSVIHSELVVDHLAFKRDWVKSRLGADPRALALITAVGDSMEPTIQENDLLLVNTRVDQVKDGCIYCINIQGDLVVKRVQRMLDGVLVIKSDNPGYQAITVSGDQAASLEIVGRVVWYGRHI